jgi:ribosomal protein S18 acetylase RimI-like enzyme
MTERFAKEVCGWKYDGPYSVYNYPGWETCKANKWDIANKGKLKRYRALITQENGQDVLCGFLRFMKGSGTVTLGLGLRPDLCGKGHGSELMRIALGEYNRAFPGRTLELYVRPFNERAIKCYERSGFAVTGRCTMNTKAGETDFVRMKNTEVR